MNSCPGATSTGTMWPGSFVAKASSPGAPMARYSVIKIDPPPATRLITPKSPPPPPNCVWVVIWIEGPIQESSPASEMIDSLFSRMNSRTGIVVPVMRLCIGCLLIPGIVRFVQRETEYTTGGGCDSRLFGPQTLSLGPWLPPSVESLTSGYRCFCLCLLLSRAYPCHAETRRNRLSFKWEHRVWARATVSAAARQRKRQASRPSRAYFNCTCGMGGRLMTIVTGSAPLLVGVLSGV